MGIVSKCKRRFGLCLIVLAASLAHSAPASAGFDYCFAEYETNTPVDRRFSTTTAMDEDWVWMPDRGTGTCVTLLNGANLNMNDQSIICARNAGCDTAVRATHPGSEVFDGFIKQSDSPTFPEKGPWSSGILGATKVRRMKITETAIAIRTKSAIDGQGLLGRQVSNSVLIDCTECINVDMEISLGQINDNYVITAPGGNGILCSGRPLNLAGQGPAIQRNYVRNYTYGIACPDSTKVRVIDNIIADPDPASGAAAPCSFGANVTLDGNHCADLACCPHPGRDYVLP